MSDDALNPEVPPELAMLSLDLQLIVKHEMQDVYVTATARAFDLAMSYLEQSGHPNAVAPLEDLRTACLLSMAESIIESRGR